MESQADIKAKLDKLSADFSAALGKISSAIADLKAQIAALQGQANPDLTPLGDAIDALDTQVTDAGNSFTPPTA